MPPFGVVAGGNGFRVAAYDVFAGTGGALTPLDPPGKRDTVPDWLRQRVEAIIWALEEPARS